MNATVRRIAVSTTATIAFLGGAGAATAAVADEHEATVLAIAHTDTQDPGDITNGIARDSGSGSALQNPGNSMQPNGVTGQQIQTQASGGVVAGGVVAILVLGIIVIVRVKHRDIKPGDAVLVGLFGIALSGTVIGAMGDQLTDSVISSLGNVLGGL